MDMTLRSPGGQLFDAGRYRSSLCLVVHVYIQLTHALHCHTRISKNITTTSPLCCSQDTKHTNMHNRVPVNEKGTPKQLPGDL